MVELKLDASLSYREHFRTQVCGLSFQMGVCNIS